MRNPEPLISQDRNPVFKATQVSDARSIPQTRGDRMWRALDGVFVRTTSFAGSAIPAHLNPFNQLGAVANTSFMVALVTGILLLFWYSPSVVSAYDSVEAMSNSPYLAGLIRSLHRYSSDLCMLFIVLHGFQTLTSRKFVGARWLAWVSGMAMVGLFFIDGWTGYWLVWDERARQVALGTAQFLDVLPIFPDPLLRTFLTNESLNSLFFFIIFFIHMLIPLMMGVFLWVHVMRINSSKLFTGRSLSVIIVACMVLVSLVWPATSEPPADMAVIPQDITVDWFYLLPLYLTDRLSGVMLWVVLGIATLVLFGIPWILSKRKPAQAIVDELACNGCTQCYLDCPYNAIQLLPRTDGKGGDVFARVDLSNCVGCGICVGSCDSSGIDQEILPLLDVRRWINQNSDGRHVAFICAESAGASLSIGPDGSCDDLPGYRVVPVPCAGWVHMLTVERALRRGAEGVLIASCHHDPVCRKGTDWTDERVRGVREPELRVDKIEPGKVVQVRFDRFEKKSFIEAAAAFQKGEPPERSFVRRRKSSRVTVGAAVAVGISLSTLALSDAGYESPQMETAELAVSFKLVGDFLPSDQGREDMGEDVPIHMRRDRPVQRERSPVRLRVELDGEELHTSSHDPGGLFNDGTSIAIEELSIQEGEHVVRIQIGTSNDPSEWNHTFEESLVFKEAQRRVVLFDRGAGFIVR